MTHQSRQAALAAAGLAHPSPDTVTAPLFAAGIPFFYPVDKIQVKYEMLRAHVVNGVSVTAAAATHGYSRPSFYLAQASFAERGIAGLLDERPGRRGPLKLTEEIVGYLLAAPADVSGAELARDVEQRFGVALHRRTVERAARRR
ncbi:MAG TPA: helix-turn-helix domain-containing protein [Pseudonocardiaceae bacterium]